MSIFKQIEPFDQAFYQARLRLVLWVCLILELIWRLGLKISLYTYYQQYQERVSWGFKIIFILWLIWQILRRAEWSSAKAAYQLAIVLALAVGLWSAVIKVILDFQFWTTLNLITEPVLVALVTAGLLFATNFVLLKINVLVNKLTHK
ncbi:MAG: hypothetical protein WCW02_01580 [Candidatus Buchananbacteria bacterium]